MKNRVKKPRLKKALFAAFFAFVLTPAGYARETIDIDKVATVNRVAQDSELEQDAVRELSQEGYYRKMKKAEKQARLEALKLQLARRKRKRIIQQMRFQTYYDNNYFRESQKLPKDTYRRADGSEIEDPRDESIVFNMVPDTIIDLSGEKVSAVLHYSPADEIPTRFDEHVVNRFYQNWGASVGIPLGRRTAAKGRYSMFRGVDRATSETTNFSLRTTNDLSSEIEYFLNRKFSTAFEYVYANNHFSDSIRDNQNSRNFMLLPRFNYYLTPKTSVFVQGGMGLTRGGNRLFDSTDARLSVGISGKLTNKSSAFINLGISRKNLREQQPFVDARAGGPYLELVYLYKTNNKFIPEIKLGSKADTESSYSAGNPFYSSRKFGTNLKQRLFYSRLFLILEGGVQFNTFTASNSATGSANAEPTGENVDNQKGSKKSKTGQRLDQVTTGKYGFRYELKRSIAIELSHALNFRTSTNLDQEYNEGLIMVEVVAEFAR